MTDVTIGSGFQAADDAPALKVRGYWRTVGYRLRHDYVTLFFAAVIVLIVLAAIFAPLLAPFDPFKTSMAYRLKPIGFRSFALGTDELGRDMLSRLIYGGRMSLLMGLIPVVLATMLGGTLGVIAGFLGGSVNMLIMRTMDVFYAFPSVLLAVAISGAMGGGMSNGLIALTLVLHPADLPRRRDRDDAGAHPRLRRGGARQRRADPVDHRASRPGQRAGAGLHLRLEPDLGRDPAGRRACRSSASASSRRRPTGA